jgi:hypothetical protein
MAIARDMARKYAMPLSFHCGWEVPSSGLSQQHFGFE